ncbi:MAG: hypothetical protein MRJ65_09175 [Candidatus Brocadiaceae bacterium]|nr:hypothetical protein [Candidatus Brocadiaceae bacterium]
MCVLGIEGGGTKTTCFLADENGNVLGRGMGGSSNPYFAGTEEIKAALQESMLGAIKSSPSPVFQIETLCAGVAGAGTEEKKIEIRNLVWKVINDHGGARVSKNFTPERHIEIHSDAVIALVAGAHKRHGIVVISGTGSVIYGETEDGKTSRAGGWGNLFDNDFVKKQLINDIQGHYPLTRFIELDNNAAQGAVLLALENAHRLR